MTVELVLLLIVLWMLFGLIDAWVLHELGHSDWRWTIVCVLTGPLSVSIVYDQRYLAEPESEKTGPRPVAIAEAPIVDINDEREPAGGIGEEWPRDDPHGPFVPQGYRGLADH
jgi:hypothetical protein